jgi:hypothetical protein
MMHTTRMRMLATRPHPIHHLVWLTLLLESRPMSVLRAAEPEPRAKCDHIVDVFVWN